MQASAAADEAAGWEAVGQAQAAPAPRGDGARYGARTAPGAQRRARSLLRNDTKSNTNMEFGVTNF